MTDEEREKLEASAFAGIRATSEIMMPTSDAQALNMFVIHALRDFSRQQQDTNTSLVGLQKEMGGVTATLIKWEERAETLKKLKEDVALLCEERQRRAGMRWMIEWLAKYSPWVIAGVAGVWALKVSASVL
jgi:hypothetical protein